MRRDPDTRGEMRLRLRYMSVASLLWAMTWRGHAGYASTLLCERVIAANRIHPQHREGTRDF